MEKNHLSFFSSSIFGAGTKCSFMLCNSLIKKDLPLIVILMSTDDQGYGDFSVLGNPVLKTPVLDKLHGQSIRFTDFHVASISTPARVQLITGHNAMDNGTMALCMGRSMVREDLPTISDILKTSGYKRAHIGKWHSGDSCPYRPQDRGFEETVHHGALGITSKTDYYGHTYWDNTVEHTLKYE